MAIQVVEGDWYLLFSRTISYDLHSIYSLNWWNPIFSLQTFVVHIQMVEGLVEYNYVKSLDIGDKFLHLQSR